MKLRRYQKKDSKRIASWIQSETQLYQWSADRLEMFPLEEDTLDSYYQEYACETYIPLSLVDEEDVCAAHLFVRKVEEDIWRFGFVIVDPNRQKQGLGKELLKQAIAYIQEKENPKKITLGVFTNNPNAYFLYKKMGFVDLEEISYDMKIGKWPCLEMEKVL
ncbi:MAG: GNAT family N-acetyltransferase [Bacillota bacterium]|nr:GNAT family N-acetyltransferase [Bacillota bacterium]